ncbi:unnamed protein product [Rotaria sp. Silwood2]|nr:unnamed protein product [Rotaria sp. Silwood2]CAF2638340.1 unnamed protein product [Rotaria sp. Silwood2]CAF4236006.1 unnamed protein product [Rotaria sp. Silwood2]CAF4477401.1 unnamed protein product [Rotaria sp. Silwood2]
MSQLCSIEKCTRTSRWLCDCCQQNLCLQHLNEHNELLISQLNPLTDEINALGNYLDTLSIHKEIADSREKLKQWREDCHKKIDSVFEQICEEINQFVNETVEEQREELNLINLKITEFITEQEITRQDINLLKSTIRQLERNMNNLEQTCFTIHIRPLVIDDIFMSIEKTTEHELDLSTLSPVYKTIHRSEGSFRPFISNDQYLLMHQHPNLCLFDQTMSLAKQTLWSYGEIQDMCWSSTLNKFILLGKNDIFLINEDTMSVDNVYTTKERQWLSCTCSETVLFACTNGRASSIMEFSLLPAIELIKVWKYPLTCSKDEFIVSSIYNNGNLALMIVNTLDKTLSMELRYAKTLDPIWSFQLNISWTQKLAFRCCSLPCNEWLVVDYETGHLLQITKDGKIKKIIEYYPTPCRAILFDINTLAVSTTNDINLHTIQ